jgi:hypothetical protein
MSIFGYKDLDYLLAEILDTKSLARFSITNKYYYGLFNDKFVTKLYIQKYSSITNLVRKDITRKIYFENEKILYDIHQTFLACTEPFNFTLLLCEIKKVNSQSHDFPILHDRDDLLCLMEHFHHKNFNYTNSQKSISRSVLVFDVIEKDSVKCFEYFMQFMKLEDNFINMAVRNKRDKILTYISNIKYNTIFTIERIFLSFKYNSPKLIELYLKEYKYFDSKTLREIMQLIDYSPNDISIWREKFNPAFNLFIKSLNSLQLERIKANSLVRNKFDTLKLISKYTSILNPFTE